MPLASNVIPLNEGSSHAAAEEGAQPRARPSQQLLKLNQMTGKVRVLERMTLPQAPKTWGTGGQPYGTSADRKTMSLDVTLTIHNGIVSNSWTW